MARRTLAVAGGETLLGREVRDIIATSGLPFDVRLVAVDQDIAGKLTEEAGEPAFVAGFDRANLEDADAVFLTGSPGSARKALEIAPAAVFIDLTHGTEESPRARLRARLKTIGG